jgi:SAM-dependent methyltransferase
VIRWLERRWSNACTQTIGGNLFWGIAVDHQSARRSLQPLIERHARGVVLDAGAGRLAWRGLIRPRAAIYLAADRIPVHDELDLLCDLGGRLPLRSGSVDTIFCCSVLEHMPEPWLVLPEFRRVLAPEGRVILSVPFLYFLHGAPHDYFRFTSYGVVDLARKAGFDVVELGTSGGYAHSLAHALSMLWCAAFWTPQLPSLVTFPVSVLAALAHWIDSLDAEGRFRQSVNVVLRPS